MIEYIKIMNEFLSEPEEIKVYGVSDTPDNGLWLVKMDNIGEISATINTTDYAIADGSFRNTNRVSKRNITMKFRLVESFADKVSQNPKNIEQSRLRLYRMFPYKSEITLYIKTDTGQYEKYIKCFVESVVPDVFSNKEQVDVSLICPDPFFKIRKKVAVGKDMIIPFNGNSRSPVVLKLNCSLLNNTQDFIIRYSNMLNIETMSFSINSIKEITGLQDITNGKLIVSSIINDKFVRYSDNSNLFNIISSLGIGPFGWGYLFNGSNHLIILVSGAPISTSTLPDENVVNVGIDAEEPSGDIVVVYDESYGGI